MSNREDAPALKAPMPSNSRPGVAGSSVIWVSAPPAWRASSKAAILEKVRGLTAL